MLRTDEERWTIAADLELVGELVLDTAGFLELRGVGARALFRAQLLLEEIVSSHAICHKVSSRPDYIPIPKMAHTGGVFSLLSLVSPLLR